VRLNIGCGARILPGWVNCDIERHPRAKKAPEILCDAKTIPLGDGVADTVMAIHVFEHFPRWEADAVLEEWKRLLKDGGRLILELPNLVKCCRNYLEGRNGKNADQLGRWGIYGDATLENRYMLHPWGYSPEELIGMLTAHGFRNAVERQTEFHPAGRDVRDMRIEAVK
jgi:predicted SAM-dependent methyltransferase